MSQWAKDYARTGNPKTDAVETWAHFKNGEEKKLRTTLIYAIPEMRRAMGPNMPKFTDQNTDLEFLTWEFQISPLPQLNIDYFFLRANDFKTGDTTATNTAVRRGAATKSAVVREVAP